MEVSGQFHRPQPLHPSSRVKDPRAHLDDMEKWKFLPPLWLELIMHYSYILKSFLPEEYYRLGSNDM
jgi:hypothetical protein